MTNEERNELAISRSNDLVAKIELSNGYFLEKMGMTGEDLQLLQLWYPGISAGEIMNLHAYQKNTGLSIMKKEVWAVRRGANRKVNGETVWVEKYEPMTGIEGARSVARRFSKEKGIPYKTAKTSYELKESYRIVEKGEDIQFEKIQDLVFRAELEIEGEMHSYEAPFLSICQKIKGRLTKFWREDFLHMGQKVVEFRLLKKTYGLEMLNVEGDSLTDIQMSEFEEVKEELKQIKGKLIELPEPVVENSESIVETSEPAVEQDELLPPWEGENEIEVELTESEKFFQRAKLSEETLLAYAKVVKLEGDTQSLLKDSYFADKSNQVKILNFAKGFKK